MKRPPIDGILLAAGESRRMGFPKPLLKVEGETFLTRSLRAMLSVARNVVVVTGAHAERVGGAVPDDPRIQVVHNSNFVRGQLSSLTCGLATIAPDAAGVLVNLADHPLVLASTYQAVAERFGAPGQTILIARYQRRRGHPVLFGREVFRELLDAPEGEGAKFVVNADPGRVVYVDVDDRGVVLDLDTPDDLRRAGLAPPPGAAQD